jgi:hypothetical protein
VRSILGTYLIAVRSILGTYLIVVRSILGTYLIAELIERITRSFFHGKRKDLNDNNNCRFLSGTHGFLLSIKLTM